MPDLPALPGRGLIGRPLPGDDTGALRLYEELGFRTRRTPVSWSLALPPRRAR